MKFLSLAFTLVVGIAVAVPTDLNVVVRATAKNVVETAQGAKDLKVLVEAVKKANLVDTLSTSNFTVFAPTDAGFLQTLRDLGFNGTTTATETDKIVQIYDGLINATNTSLTKILTYHALPEPLNSTELTEMGTFTAVSGVNLTLNNVTLEDVPDNVRDAKLVPEMFDIEANGSFVHKIDRVLLPIFVDLAVTKKFFNELPENLTKKSPPPCFPASSIVHTADGQDITMADLAAGHSVKVSESSRFSTVYLFSHKQHQGLQSFVRVTADSGHSITLSPTHYMYANGKLVAGRSVKVGDVIRTVKGPATVKSVENVKDFGLVAPHTMHGDIVVNGIVASSYTTAVHPRLAHLLLAPVRAVVRMGISKEPLGSSLYDGAPRLAKMVPSGPDSF